MQLQKQNRNIKVNEENEKNIKRKNKEERACRLCEKLKIKRNAVHLHYICKKTKKGM